MDFKTFFTKKILMSFFISTTCITAVIAILGMLFEPDKYFGYSAYFSPLIFGALATLPQLITYSKKELTLKQTIVRKLIFLLLLELLVVFTLYSAGTLTSASIVIALVLSVLIIFLTVHLVIWVNDSTTAREFNKSLKVLQSKLQT